MRILDSRGNVSVYVDDDADHERNYNAKIKIDYSGKRSDRANTVEPAQGKSCSYTPKKREPAAEVHITKQSRSWNDVGVSDIYTRDARQNHKRYIWSNPKEDISHDQQYHTNIQDAGDNIHDRKKSDRNSCHYERG